MELRERRKQEKGGRRCWEEEQCVNAPEKKSLWRLCARMRVRAFWGAEVEGGFGVEGYAVKKR